MDTERSGADPAHTEGQDAGPLDHLIGVTVLVEIDGDELTGQVADVEASRLIVVFDSTPPADDEHVDVGVSVFAADALYRLHGQAVVEGGRLTTGEEIDFERIQRRKWPRRRMDLQVTLCPVSDGRRVEGVPGRTVDVSVGGVCVETLRPLEGAVDPMVILSLPDGHTIVSGAVTVAVQDLGDGWRYRLAFQDLDAHDAGRLAGLTSG